MAAKRIRTTKKKDRLKILQNEINVSKNLSEHNNIVTYVSSIKARVLSEKTKANDMRDFYLFYEFCNGGDLKTWNDVQIEQSCYFKPSIIKEMTR